MTTSNKRAFLTTEKFPFLLALLFAMVAYSLNHIVDRVTAMPIIEYSVIKIRSGKEFIFTYQISNITPDKQFSDIVFLLSAGEKDTITNAKPFIHPPIVQNSTTDIFEKDTKTVKLPLKSFQPNSDFVIVLSKQLDEEIPLRISCATPIFLTKPSLKTYLQKNEITILIILTSVCIILILIYFFRL
jgi:hypothetical protein